MALLVNYKCSLPTGTLEVPRFFHQIRRGWPNISISNNWWFTSYPIEVYFSNSTNINKNLYLRESFVCIWVHFKCYMSLRMFSDNKPSKKRFVWWNWVYRCRFERRDLIEKTCKLLKGYCWIEWLKRNYCTLYT